MRKQTQKTQIRHEPSHKQLKSSKFCICPDLIPSCSSFLSTEDTGIWIGLSDLHHDAFRWIVDNTRVTYSTWFPGFGSKQKDKTCVAFDNGSKVEWFNTVCSSNYHYICEANNCKYNITIV